MVKRFDEFLNEGLSYNEMLKISKMLEDAGEIINGLQEVSYKNAVKDGDPKYKTTQIADGIVKFERQNSLEDVQYHINRDGIKKKVHSVSH